MVSVEVAMFKLKKGLSRETLFEASEEMQKEFLEKQEGYIKRDFLISDNDDVMDYVFWETEKLAKSAGEKFMKSDFAKNYMDCIDMSSGSMNHYNLEKSYN